MLSNPIQNLSYNQLLQPTLSIDDPNSPFSLLLSICPILPQTYYVFHTLLSDIIFPFTQAQNFKVIPW